MAHKKMVRDDGSHYDENYDMGYKREGKQGGTTPRTPADEADRIARRIYKGNMAGMRKKKKSNPGYHGGTIQ